MGIPTVLHEANASAGFAVKRLASKVDVILTNFEQTANKITNCKRAVGVGMPMRGEFEKITKEEARKNTIAYDRLEKEFTSTTIHIAPQKMHS